MWATCLSLMDKDGVYRFLSEIASAVFEIKKLSCMVNSTNLQKLFKTEFYYVTFTFNTGSAIS